MFVTEEVIFDRANLFCDFLREFISEEKGSLAGSFLGL